MSDKNVTEPPSLTDKSFVQEVETTLLNAETAVKKASHQYIAAKLL
jgi:hypothetical protein